MDDVFAMIFEGFTADRLLTRLGHQIRRPDGTQKPYPLLFQLIYREYQTRLDPREPHRWRALVRRAPASSPIIRRPVSDYIDWLRTNAGNAEKLRAQDFAGAARPTSLLLYDAAPLATDRGQQQPVRASCLSMMYRRSSWSPAANSSGSPRPSTSRLGRSSAGLFGSILSGIADDAPLLHLCSPPQFLVGHTAHIGAPLQGVVDSLDVLRTLPTARLERLLAEHLDTLSSAWMPGRPGSSISGCATCAPAPKHNRRARGSTWALSTMSRMFAPARIAGSRLTRRKSWRRSFARDATISSSRRRAVAMCMHPPSIMRPRPRSCATVI